jgi:hypothetical protein
MAVPREQTETANGFVQVIILGSFAFETLIFEVFQEEGVFPHS